MKKILLVVTLLAATFQMTFAQEATVTGRITDETGAGLPGANVLIKGTTKGALTDPDGKFTLSASPDAVLQISSIGYQTKEITVGNQTNITHQMVLDVTQLSEVVVTGYATEQKKDIVGSVSIVKPGDLLATPSGTVTNQLQGRSPGVTVQSDGTPGGGSKVRVRGIGSFSGSDPLYVIDGVPTTGGINNLNPNDVESLQVLKDAAAASIYGARAANGVVIVTTKKGKAGPAKITIDSYYAINYFSKNNFPDLLNAQQYGDMYWASMAGAHTTLINKGVADTDYQPGGKQWQNAQYGTGATPVVPDYVYVNNSPNVYPSASAALSKYGGGQLAALNTPGGNSVYGIAYNPALYSALIDPANYNYKTHQIVQAGNTNWFAETFNPASQQSHQISASGGSDAGSFNLGLNFYDQNNTTSQYAFYDRFTIRANTSYNIKKNIRIGENLQVGYNKQRAGANTAQAWTMTSLIPVKDIMGGYASGAAPDLVAVGDTGHNPIDDVYRSRFNKNANYNVFGNAYAEVDIVKGLTARSSFGIDYASGSTLTFTPVTYEHAENTGVSGQSLNSSTSNSNTWTWTNTLNYSKTFAEKHAFKIIVGSEAIKTYTESVSAVRQSANGTTPAYAIDEDPNFLTINSGVGTQTNSGTFTRNSLYSLFARVDYAYADKYLFNATMRRDQSSKFGPNNRTGYFPAAAIGWRLSAEEFMKGVSWVNDLKLRASYGVIGNQSGLPNETRYTTISQNLGEGYPTGGANNAYSNSYVVGSAGNPNVKWERNITTNIGVDATLFNNSLDVTAEYYVKETDGLLVQNQQPYTGFSGTQPFLNAGDMTNKGIDLGITKRGNIVEGLRYEVGLTFTHYKNNVTRVLASPAATITGGGTRLSTPPSITAVGKPISQYYGFITDGFFNSQEDVNAYNAKYNPTGLTQPWIEPAIGRWKIKDVNNDGVINDFDRTYIGTPHPKFQMGMNLSLGYKNFDFTAFLFWNQGGQLFNYSRYNVDFNTFKYNRSDRMLNDSWTPEHMNAKLPRLDLLDTYSNKYPTNYYVESATYLRVKTLQLGYNFPTAVLSRIKLDKLRIYVQSQNLFTAKKTTALDPDTALSGGDTAMGIVNGGQPTPKQILMGINIGF